MKRWKDMGMETRWWEKYTKRSMEDQKWKA